MGSDSPEGLCSSCLISFGVDGFADERAPASADSPREHSASTPALCELGDYELREEVARGGMGVVYRARQKRLDRIVAVKLILVGQWASPKQVQRFKGEAEAAAKLDHPNIVPIYEIGEAEGQHFFSMKFVDGGNLAQRVPGFALHGSNFRESAGLLVKIARAVHYAHQRGIVHRDLKPTNILLDARGEPHVTDFGLAKVFQDETGATVSAVLLGTPAYMAPEQAVGQGGRVTTAVDIYSLGAILYELLTGRPPFTGGSALEILHAAGAQEPEPPRHQNPAVPRDLEIICLKCLSKTPSRRYGSAEALAIDLEQWLAGAPIQARPVHTAERLWLWARRKPVLAGLTLTVAVLVIAVAIGSSIAAARFERQRDEARRSLYSSYLNEARATRQTSLVGRRFRALEAIQNAAAIRQSADLRNEAITALALPDLAVAHRWAGFPNGARGLAFSQDFRLYARGDDDGTSISIRDLATDHELSRLPFSGRAFGVHRFGAEARLLGARLDQPDGKARVAVWDWRTTNLLWEAAACAESFGTFEWLPNRDELLLVDEKGGVERRAGVTGRVLNHFELGAVPGFFAISPSGRYCAVTFNSGGDAIKALVKVVSLPMGAEVANFQHPGHVHQTAWHPDENQLAVGCNDHRVHVWDVAEKRSLGAVAHQSMPVQQVAFGPSGRYLFTAGIDRNLAVWDYGRDKKLVATEGVAANFARGWTDTEPAIGVDGTNILRWRFEMAAECRLLPESRPAGNVLSFTPDSRFLLAANRTETCIWDANNGELAGRFTNTNINNVLIAPNVNQAFICAEDGLFRANWIVRYENGRSSVELESLERLPVPDSGLMTIAALSGDARTIAVAVDYSRALVCRLDSNGGEWKRFEPRGVSYVALSNDGDWLATGPGRNGALQVWETQSGRRVLSHQTPNSQVCFSQDGRWFAGSVANDYCLWETKTWRIRHQLPRRSAPLQMTPVAISADNQWLAVAPNPTAVSLFEVGSAGELAAFQVPQSGIVEDFAFSPDKKWLAVSCREAGVYVWNIPLVRTRLAELKLDW
jgi:WD40 repeat protein/predicted Ser/Thr protein kinase